MKGVIMFFLAAILVLFTAFFFYAFAAQTNWPAAKNADKAVKRSVEISGNKLHAKTEKGSKKETRTFPCMFDICGRSSKARAEKRLNKK